MNEKKITVEKQGHVLLMGLNRPDKDERLRRGDVPGAGRGLRGA